MVSNRKLRIVALALAVVTITILLWVSRLTPNIQSQQRPNGNNALIDSQNDAKLDAAINQEISKTKDQEIKEGEVGAAQPLKEPQSKGDSNYDAAQDFLEMRALAPMLVFSKTYCPFSKRLKKLLKENYSVTPDYKIIEIDKHEHSSELQDYLAEVTGRRTVPNVIVGSSTRSRGGADDMIELHEQNSLARLLNEWGQHTISVERIEKPSNL